MNLDIASKWHRQLGQLTQAHVVSNPLETVWELDDICNLCALAKITKTPVPRVAETQAEGIEAGDGVHRRDGTFQSRITVRVPVLHCVC